MSRNFAVLDKAPPGNSHPPFGAQPPHDPSVPSSEYAALVERLFLAPSVVAILAVGPAGAAAAVCDGIAIELALSGKPVVIVAVHELLNGNPISPPDETTFQPGNTPHVWRWPSPAGQQIEFFKPRIHAAVGPLETWLDSLRRNFDSVLLDCPSVETAPGGAAVAALADAALLVVEAARVSKQQILRDQRALQLSGVKLAGCILAGRS
jgi:hypothetical protein